ncbi:hypothetical protein SANTM175S_04842 [Streptomyces antimycoticus]
MSVPADHPFAAAVRPLVDAMGGEMIAPDRARGDDVVLSWEGRPVVAVRLPHISDSLDHILADLRRRHGVPLWPSTARPSRPSSATSNSAAPSRCATASKRSPEPSA